MTSNRQRKYPYGKKKKKEQGTNFRYVLPEFLCLCASEPLDYPYVTYPLTIIHSFFLQPVASAAMEGGTPPREEEGEAGGCRVREGTQSETPNYFL